MHVVAKNLDHTTKYTKSTKVIYLILLFLRDLRGKNKTDLFWFRPVRLTPLGRREGLSGLGHMIPNTGCI